MNKNGVIAVVVIMAAVLLTGMWILRTGGRPGPDSQLDCTAAPERPTNAAYTKAGATVTVTWTAPAGNERPATYVIEAGNASGLDNAGTFIGPGTVTRLERDVPPGTYYVRVFARNACGTSAASNEILVTVP